MDRRTLALIYLAHASDVLENAFSPLSDDDYEVAMKRVRELLDLDCETETVKEGTNELLWAVISTLSKWVRVQAHVSRARIVQAYAPLHAVIRFTITAFIESTLLYATLYRTTDNIYI